jgi:hypothetical protein
MYMKNSHRSIITGVILGLATLPAAAQTTPPQDSEAASWTGMFSEGKANFDFRYRYEYVDQDGFGPEAKASTLRSKVAFSSAAYRGLSFLLEFSNVSYIGDDDFNSTENGKTQYPVVADPKGTEVNQALLKYRWEELVGTYGRQLINLGNQRFVGAVAWRQNEQTFDGLRARWQGDHGLNVDYAYIYKVNRIFGPDDSAVQPAEWDGDFNFLRADYTFLENHNIAAYLYSLEVDNRSRWTPNKSVNNSSNTYGIEYRGTLGPISARAAYATQSDAGDSQLDYDTEYYVVEAASKLMGVTGKLGYEVLGADNGTGFSTPLATLHKFQGWADMFLVTPGEGIEDLYIGLSGSAGPVLLEAVWHDFQAKESSDDYGSEIDLAATWPINKQFSLQLKYAGFSTDDSRLYRDTDKAWLTAIFKI